MRVVAVALELKHAVDEVLQDARARDRTVLGDVTDEEESDTGLLADAEQARRGLAHLRDRPGRRADFRGVEGVLDRVDHADVGSLALQRGADGVQIRLREDLDHLRAAEPRRAKLDLGRRFLAGHERAPLAGDRRERRQQQGRLPDAGLTADQDE